MTKHDGKKLQKKITLNHHKYNENFLQVENSAVDHLDMIL
jgi:hypothetical protein